jgi:hypothetical protein
MVWVALVAWTVATGAAQGSKETRHETVARWQFVGIQGLKELKDQHSLQQVLNLPESVDLRAAAFNALSSRAAARFAKEAGPEARKTAEEQVRILLPDLLAFETRFQMTAAGTNADWALAVRLPEDRHAAWKGALSGLARAGGLKVNESEGWSAARENYSLWLKRQKEWTLFEGGYTPSPQRQKLFAELRNGLEKKAGKEVLVADFNFPRLGELWHAPRLAHAPRLKVSGTPNRDGLRSEVELEYPRDLGIKPEKWQIPTSLMRDPLIGFTALQGVRETLAASPRVQALGLKNTPNQLFTWALNESPFSTYFAANVGNPQAVVSNLFEHFAEPKEGGLRLGQPHLTTNGHSFVLRGLPVVIPFVEAGTGQASDFLHAGFFPAAPGKTNKVPGDLFAQLNKSNVIFYEWEITESRLKHWRPLWQIAYMANPRKALRGGAVSDRWIDAIMPLLGNTITEGTLESERKIKIVRQSHSGFNALELVLLAHWLDPNDVRDVVPGAQPQSPPPLDTSSGKTSGPQNAETGR